MINKKMRRNTVIFKIILIFLLAETRIFPTVFDSVKWNLEKSKNNISLYIQDDKNLKINFYKAETIVNGIDMELIFNNIADCNQYKKIFTNIEIFEIVEFFSNNSFLLLAELNFFPYKNRSYLAECSLVKDDENNTFIFEWHPIYDFKKESYIKNKKNNKIVSFIYGRWMVKKIDDNMVYVSIEYHNDWETNLPLKFIHEVEKFYTIKNLQTIINYTFKQQKNLLKLHK
ncbi:MAG: hypothetical protein JXB50_02120 [Spirochaetes bacterium]|nr:hypothetical protein [Spirochaetota bacterium]